VIRGGDDSEHTVRLLARDPLSVPVITSEVVAFSLVDGTVVVQLTVESVRHRTALGRNGRGLVTLTTTPLRFIQLIE